MLFYILAAIFAIGIVMLIAERNTYKYAGSMYETIGELTFYCGFIGVAVSLILIIGNSIGVEKQIEKLRIHYDSIIYQIENNLYSDSELAKKELINDITEWNSSVTEGKYLETNRSYRY